MVERFSPPNFFESNRDAWQRDFCPTQRQNQSDRQPFCFQRLWLKKSLANNMHVSRCDQINHQNVHISGATGILAEFNHFQLLDIQDNTLHRLYSAQYTISGLERRSNSSHCISKFNLDFLKYPEEETEIHVHALKKYP